jgi:hypothetical protein
MLGQPAYKVRKMRYFDPVPVRLSEVPRMSGAWVLVVGLWSGPTLPDPEHLTHSQCMQYVKPYRKARIKARCVAAESEEAGVAKSELVGTALSR